MAETTCLIGIELALSLDKAVRGMTDPPTAAVFTCQHCGWPVKPVAGQTERHFEHAEANPDCPAVTGTGLE